MMVVVTKLVVIVIAVSKVMASNTGNFQRVIVMVTEPVVMLAVTAPIPVVVLSGTNRRVVWH